MKMRYIQISWLYEWLAFWFEFIYDALVVPVFFIFCCFNLKFYNLFAHLHSAPWLWSLLYGDLKYILAWILPFPFFFETDYSIFANLLRGLTPFDSENVLVRVEFYNFFLLLNRSWMLKLEISICF